MEATLNTVLLQMEQDGQLPCRTQSNSSQSSLLVTKILSSALAKVKDRFPTIEDFMVAVNPDRQLKICEQPETCYFGNSPTLASLNVIYGRGAAEAWLLPEVQEACLFMGIKEMPDNYQAAKLVRIIAQQYGYLNVDEVQLFFFYFCSARYRHFYNTFDPSIIILSLRDFLRDRSRAYEEREQREREREREEWEKNAITHEEYLRLKENQVL